MKVKYDTNYKQRSFQEIGDILGISKQRVEQIYKGAMKKLSHPKYGKVLKILNDNGYTEMSKEF